MLNKLKVQFGTSIKRILATPTVSSATTTTTTTPSLAAGPFGEGRGRTPVPPAPPAPPPTVRRAGHHDAAAVRARRQKRLQLRRMQRDLFDLLEQHADARRLMRHLGLVERSLRKGGLAAVEALPPEVVDKALAQLESLVQDWSSEGLAELRSRMAVMLRNPAPRTVADRQLDDGADDDEMAQLGRGLIVTVDEAQISATDQAAFEEMERSWAGRMPPGLTTARGSQGDA